MAGRWFFLDTPVSRTNKTDRHDITEIVYNVTLDTITRKLMVFLNILHRNKVFKIPIKHIFVCTLHYLHSICLSERNVVIFISHSSRRHLLYYNSLNINGHRQLLMCVVTCPLDW
jgi:hypothetical protein